MKDAVRCSHRLQAKISLQSLWAGRNLLLAWFAQTALVSLLSVATRDLSFYFCLFFPLYAPVKQTRFVLSTYEYIVSFCRFQLYDSLGTHLER